MRGCINAEVKASTSEKRKNTEGEGEGEICRRRSQRQAARESLSGGCQG